MEDENIVRQRLMRVIRTEKLLTSTSPVLIESDSNDVWKLGDYYVRICWRGDRERLRREAIVAGSLPKDISYPPIVSVGADDDYSWMITKAVPGNQLSSIWDELNHREQRDAVDQYATMLQALHEWQPDPEMSRLIKYRTPEGATQPDVIVGNNMTPLPIRRALMLAKAAKQLPFVDPHLIDAVEKRLQTLNDPDPFLEDQVIVHCDASFTNILWHKSHITAFLDFEWVRFGPRDLELPPLMDTRRPEIMAMLKAAYPALFAHPNVIAHLWMYELAGALRGLLVWPPKSPEDMMNPNKAAGQLKPLLESPSKIESLLKH